MKILPAFVLLALSMNSSAQLVINEIHADPASGLAGDANGDGIRDGSDDEFVELVNNSGGSLDIGNWQIFETGYSSTARHTFAVGTILPDRCAIVVFGGGSVENLGGGAFF